MDVQMVWTETLPLLFASSWKERDQVPDLHQVPRHQDLSVSLGITGLAGEFQSWNSLILCESYELTHKPPITQQL